LSLLTRQVADHLLPVRETYHPSGHAGFDVFGDFDKDRFQNQRSQEALPLFSKQIAIEFRALSTPFNCFTIGKERRMTP